MQVSKKVVCTGLAIEASKFRQHDGVLTQLFYLSASCLPPIQKFDIHVCERRKTEFNNTLLIVSLCTISLPRSLYCRLLLHPIIFCCRSYLDSLSLSNVLLLPHVSTLPAASALPLHTLLYFSFYNLPHYLERTRIPAQCICHPAKCGPFS